MASDALKYFRSVEDAFLRLRGAPLVLSPADWEIAKRWREAGIPLELVVEAMEEVFDRREERGETRRVNGLRYCAPQVEASWEAQEALLGPTAGPERAARAAPDVGERLEALARSIPGSWEPGAAVAAAVRGLRGRTGEVEGRLEALDAEMMRAAVEGLDDRRRRQAKRRAEDRLALVGDRLAENEIEPVRRRLYEAAVRSLLSLPRLSLFSPDARSDQA